MKKLFEEVKLFEVSDRPDNYYADHVDEIERLINQLIDDVASEGLDHRMYVSDTNSVYDYVSGQMQVRPDKALVAKIAKQFY
jgi:hypothetical protein